jgi:hypothetical protein
MFIKRTQGWTGLPLIVVKVKGRPLVIYRFDENKIFLNTPEHMLIYSADYNN